MVEIRATWGFLVRIMQVAKLGPCAEKGEIVKPYESELQLYRVPFRIGCFLVRNDPIWCSLCSHMLGSWGPLFAYFERWNQPGNQERTRIRFEFGVWVLSLEL